MVPQADSTREEWWHPKRMTEFWTVGGVCQFEARVVARDTAKQILPKEDDETTRANLAVLKHETTHDMEVLIRGQLFRVAAKVTQFM